MAVSINSWYVVYAKPHREAVAETHLRRSVIDVFFPKLDLPPYAAGARRVVPLFPGYLFACLDLAAHAHEVSRTPGVNRLVGAAGVPTPLDANVIAFLKRHATEDGCLRGRPDVRRGQEVQITGGPFAGLIGIIDNPPDPRGRIRVLMRLLNRHTVPVRMSMRSVQTDWTT